MCGALVAQRPRAEDSKSFGRGFESRLAHNAPVAQRREQRILKPP